MRQLPFLVALLLFAAPVFAQGALPPYDKILADEAVKKTAENYKAKENEQMASRAYQAIVNMDNAALNALKECVFTSAAQMDDGISDVRTIWHASILACAQQMKDVKGNINFLGFLSNGQNLEMIQQSLESETDLLLLRNRAVAAAALKKASEDRASLLSRLALAIPFLAFLIFCFARWTSRPKQKGFQINDTTDSNAPSEEDLEMAKQKRNQRKKDIRAISDRDFWISAITSREQADRIIQRGTKDFLYLYSYFMALLFLSFWFFGNKLNALGGSPLVPMPLFIIGMVLTVIVRRTGSTIAAGLHMLMQVLPSIVILGLVIFALFVGYLPIWFLVFNAPSLMFIALIAWTTIRIFVATRKSRELAKQ